MLTVIALTALMLSPLWLPVLIDWLLQSRRKSATMETHRPTITMGGKLIGGKK
jgi:hypothetical protein